MDEGTRRTTRETYLPESHCLSPAAAAAAAAAAAVPASLAAVAPGAAPAADVLLYGVGSNRQNAVYVHLALLQCGAKLGSWSWAGLKCSCGQWNAPAFQVNPKP